MKKILFSLLVLTFLTNFGYSQWVANYSPNRDGGEVTNSKGTDVKTDNTGNCFVTGYTNFSANGNDIILIKYSLLGVFMWAQTFDGNAHSDDNSCGFGVDAYGNAYVTGYVTNPNTGTDIILLKYDPYGNLTAQATFNGSGNTDDKALAIVVDNAGNSYITGYTTDSVGNICMVTLKYNSSCSLVWKNIETGNNSGDSKGLGIAVDNPGNVGNVYVTGYTRNSDGNNDIYVLRYDTDGSSVWNAIYPGAGNGDDQAKSIGVDASGNVYVSGYITSSTNGKDYALAKFNSSGTLQWLKSENGSGNSDDRALGIAVDNTDGSIYITGYETNPTGTTDYMTMKYSSAGTQVWKKPYDGTGHGNDKANDIALIRTLGVTTNVVVTGGSWGTNYNLDYATVKYSSSNGSLTQVSRYSYSANTSDDAKGVAVSPILNTIYVTGCSVLILDAGMEQSYISTECVQGGERSELNALSEVPSTFNLYQNYPNPFNPSTNIKFDVNSASDVKLAVYDVTGKAVQTLINQYMTPGSYTISFNSSSLSSGVYFYELTAGTNRSIKKMTLIK